MIELPELRPGLAFLPTAAQLLGILTTVAILKLPSCKTRRYFDTFFRPPQPAVVALLLFFNSVRSIVLLNTQVKIRLNVKDTKVELYVSALTS